MKRIPLTQGQYALVDDEDFDCLSKYKWSANKDHNTFYALRHFGTRKDQKTIIMHREIMNTPKGMHTDHIDGNGLNNQKSNLRICTNAQNQHNTGKRKSNTSGYKGVSWSNHNKKWQVQFLVKGKNIFVGCFNDPIDAAHAYDDAIVKYHGEYAKLNFEGNK